VDYEITLHANWRPDHRLLHPGHYRIPEDISDELAQRAIAEAGATRRTPVKTPAPANKTRAASPQQKA
jgi:hypothetical protein